MDRLTVLQEAIDRTSTAAAQYGAGTGCLEIHGSDILTSRHQDPHGWVVGSLQRYLLNIADHHAGCTEPGCGTCEALRDGLAVSLRVLRNMQQEELETQLAATSKTSWWRAQRNERA